MRRGTTTFGWARLALDGLYGTGTLRAALVACGALALAALAAGAVRLLPWLFDPQVPWRVAFPFARGLATLAIEAAVVVGWPVGWALGTFRFVESGEARVLETLGERPLLTVARLVPQSALFLAVLAVVAVVGGKDASEPGRVATELIDKGRISCAAASEAKSYAVPFTELAWLCAPGRTPRLVGRSPDAMSGATFTATEAKIAGDFRSLEMKDAHLVLGPAKVRVKELALRGLSPWSRASTLPPVLRGLLFTLTGMICAAGAALAVLRGLAGSRTIALVLGAVGPVVALAVLRALERADARPYAFLAMPLAAAAVICVIAVLASRLPLLMAAARKRKG
jgi:hypothetical protein